jgi:pimeloyl-ACP methyl ester carboxylesterase
MDDDFTLRVRLPPDVDEAETYPLVIQLDPTFAGLRQFDHTVGLVSSYEVTGEWPTAIVVGVDYDDPNKRFRDYTPTEPLDPGFAAEDGADRFFAALRDDVLPHIDEHYPTDSGQRILLGHSNGAVFAWYAAFRHEDGVPPLFASLVAADAGISEFLFTLERWHSERATDLPIRLYTSRADYNGPVQEITWNALIERLEQRGFTSLALQAEVLITDHGGAVVPSFEHGLAHAFGATP